MNNTDLKRDLEKIKRWQESIETDTQKIAISKEVDYNLDYPYAIDVEDESYFYANESKRDDDFKKLSKILTHNTNKHIYSY